MRSPVPVVLAGPHARLEPLGPEHVADLFVAGQDDEVWRWLPVGRPREPADVARLVEQARADPARLAFAAVVDGRAVGCTSYLDVDLEVAGLEIGWTWYAQSHWATTLNASCKLLLLGHAFDQLGAERVTLKTDSLNLRSQAAIRRLGAHEDGTLRHARRRRDGSVRDSVYFSVLVAEWPVVREGLLTRLQRTTDA